MIDCASIPSTIILKSISKKEYLDKNFFPDCIGSPQNNVLGKGICCSNLLSLLRLFRSLTGISVQFNSLNPQTPKYFFSLIVKLYNGLFYLFICLFIESKLKTYIIVIHDHCLILVDMLLTFLMVTGRNDHYD